MWLTCMGSLKVHGLIAIIPNNMETVVKNIKEFFGQQFTLKNGVYLAGDNPDGYWSNLSKNENSHLLGLLDKFGPKAVIERFYPKLYEVIYSKKREAGLELLELQGSETCIDYGCMWGAMTVPLAKRVAHVISVDQTLESLRFLSSRCLEEEVENITIVNQDIKSFQSCHQR